MFDELNPKLREEIRKCRKKDDVFWLGYKYGMILESEPVLGAKDLTEFYRKVTLKRILRKEEKKMMALFKDAPLAKFVTLLAVGTGIGYIRKQLVNGINYIDKKILEKMVEKERFMTTNEVARETKFSWNTVYQHLMRLQRVKFIDHIERGNRDLWRAEASRENNEN
jgi:hypothetical protein